MSSLGVGMEEESLRSLVAQLESELKEKEKDVHTAAELGKKLLDSNQELQNQLDENFKSYSERIESLEQDKFSLQQRLEAQKATAGAMQQEFETSSAQLEQKYSQQLKHSEENQSRKVHELSKVNSDLKAENEKLEVQVKTCLEKARIQEETIEQLHEDINSKCNTTVLQHELKDLEQLYTDEKSHNEELRLLVVESEGNVEMLSVELASLQEKVASLEEECQDRNRMANEWYEALQESKDQNVQLNCQLEALKMEVMGEGHLRSGNSLFGEVDDRRMQIERKMISLKVRYETLEKTHSTTQHQLRKMKADMSALLCQYGATSADAAHTQRLTRALAQCKSENQALLAKLHRLEKQQAESDSAQQQMKCVSAFVDFGNKTEYIQFLEQELEQVKGAHSSVIKELDMKRTQLLWESNKLSEAEAKIHHTEQEMARLKKEFTKVRMKLQDSTEKLAEADLQTKQLLADKAYLEEHLKNRGTKNRIREKNQEKTDLDVTGKVNTFSKFNQSVACSHEGGNRVADETVREENKDNLNTTNTVTTTVVKREINILDDLEKEFNKQRLQQKRGVDSWQKGGVVKEMTGRGSGSFDERQSANNSDSGLGTENTPESSFLSTTNSSHAVQHNTLPPKVIQVHNDETVNECPQQ